MKNLTKGILAAITLIAGLLQNSAVQQAIVPPLLAMVKSHPNLAVAVTGLSAIVLALHNPKSAV